MKKSIFGFMMLSLVVCFTLVWVNAEEDRPTINKRADMVQPNFENITVFISDLSINSSGQALVSSIIDARNGDQVHINTYLQRYQNGGWITVKSWNVIEEGTYTALEESWHVVSGHTYRISSYGYVYEDGELLESTSYTSATVNY